MTEPDSPHPALLCQELPSGSGEGPHPHRAWDRKVTGLSLPYPQGPLKSPTAGVPASGRIHHRGQRPGLRYVLEQENQSELKMKGSGGVKWGQRLPDGTLAAGRPRGPCRHICPPVSVGPGDTGK